jgi:nitrogenase-stabilizing/protective protein
LAAAGSPGGAALSPIVHVPIQREFSMSNSHPSAGILDRLNKASSAEEFFSLLGVEYDPGIVNVARLHILKRMGQYLAKEQFAGAAEPDIRARCKAMLEQAYADFVASSPIDQRVFNVLKDAVADHDKPMAFVPLSELK